MSDQLSEVREELRALAARVAELEQDRAAAASDAIVQVPESEAFWALAGLKQRLAEHPATEGGAVMLVGALTLPDGAPVEWQEAVGTEGLLESDWSELAAVFASLGHPVRLELLRLILTGTDATSELARTEGLGTTGQLHHHLRQLVAAGWVRQTGRGRYEVPAGRVVPLLAALGGGRR